jgi:molecular chaperone GrpE
MAETGDTAPQADAPQAPPPQEPVADDARAQLQARVDALEAREKELLERLARMQADFENFRRRSREDAAQAANRGKEAFLKALLPTLDNLDRALAHAEDAGLRMISRQLSDALAAQGLTVVDPAGQAFDAKLHEAVAEEGKEGAKPGSVVTVLEKGYVLDGRVLRPARVVVARGA